MGPEKSEDDAIDGNITAIPHTGEIIDSTDTARLEERLMAALGHSPRAIIGLAGPPGVGKSAFAARLAEVVKVPAAVVPFDGFHLSDAILRSLGLQERKGAIETFDVGGYRALIERIRNDPADVIYAPAYFREIEEAIAAAIPVPRSVRLVITEGNYLLSSDHELTRTRAMLDEVWYLQADESARMRRLIERHVAAGKDRTLAEAWARGTDEANAALIRATRPRADLVVRIVEDS
jgi:pantothenate kinase